MNFIIQPYRYALSIAVIAAGFLLMETAPLFWPPIYQNARAAILVMFLGFALLTLAGDTQGRIRSASGLAVGAALLAASALALTDPTIAAGVLLDSFKAWRNAGYSGIESIRGMVSTWDRFTEARKLGVQTSLAIGLPVPLFFILRAISIAAPAPSSRISTQGPWRARWMNRQELRQLSHNDTGLPLGLSGGAMLRYRPNQKTGWRAGHHVAIAGTRAGKGVSVVIPAIIDHDGPVAVLDIKGENFAVTRRYRRSLGRQVVVLNPFGVIEPSKDRFNPLDYIRQAHLVRDIEVIAEGLVRPEGGNGAHFAEMAKSMIAAVIEVVMTRRAEADRNLITVMDLLFSAGFEKTLTEWASAPETFGTRPAAAAATFLAAGENERGAIKTTVKKAFDWARSDEMRTFLGSSTCSLENLFDGRADLFMVVPLDQVDAQAVFLRLLTNIILGMAVRLEGAKKPKKNVLLVLDEFVRLGRMEKLINIANVAAGCGIEALFITQDKGQIESVYGKGDTASILGSCVTTRIFGLGRAEFETANWAANALGDQTVLTRTKQSAAKFGESRKTSTAEQRQKLMTADQILEMKTGKMLLLTGSKPPALIDAIVSHRHPAYRGKLDRNPMVG